MVMEDSGLSVERVNTILYCRRWAETVEFYRDLLGLKPGFANEWFVEFSLGGGSYLSIADAARASIEPADGQGLTLSLEVRELTEVRRWLEERGVEPGEVRRRFGSPVFDVCDPEGHRLEFWSRDDA